MKTSEILKLARKEIENPDHWDKGEFAKTKKGDEGAALRTYTGGKATYAETPGMEPAAPGCFCGLGALIYVSPTQALYEKAWPYLVKALVEVLDKEDERRIESLPWLLSEGSKVNAFTLQGFFYDFNDADITSHEEVMEVYDKAIQLAEADEDKQ